jgi:cysteine desulfurase
MRVAGHCHVTFEGLASDELLFLLDQRGVCASAASSCASGAGQVSHVLAAMGVEESGRGVRCASRWVTTTTETEVDALIAAVSSVVYHLRQS